MGRPNNVKPKKSKRCFLKNSRPSSCINGAEHGSQEHRPKKRSRSCLEGGCNSGDHVNTGGSRDKGFDKGFEGFFLDLDKAASIEYNFNSESKLSQGGMENLNQGGMELPTEGDVGGNSSGGQVRLMCQMWRRKLGRLSM
ncbi:hypothetical protein Hanom_Chr15g01404031 [Helianthus anomalus]